MTVVRHSDPELARQLRGQSMELQCAEQAEYRLRHLGDDDSQASCSQAGLLGSR